MEALHRLFHDSRQGLDTTEKGSNMVKRYKLFVDSMADCFCEIDHHHDGGYVDYDDYAKLEHELAEARECINRANAVLHGYGVEDQGEAHDQACRLLDEYESSLTPTAPEKQK